MKTLSIAALLLVSFAASTAPSAMAQPQHTTQPKAVQPPQTDAQWAKQNASNCSASPNQCTGSGINIWDHHFLSLLRHSLPQSESWWVNDHLGHSSVTNVVTAFLGIPESSSFDDNRYLTATGCVPHVCTVKGMIWIDTGTHPSTVVFVAENMITGKDAGYHLWLYASKPMNFERLPSDFFASLTNWHNVIAANAPNYDPQIFSLVTLVQPNGAERDLNWNELFSFNHNSPANNTGAKQ